jgi:phenylacetate-CoA ligase
MRAEIEEVFQVPVFDRYGSREVSAMAAECGAHQGLHVQMPGYIVETIDPATGRNVEEQLGEIVITVLNNFAMPFLRYRIGDMGKLTRKPCPCGRNTVRLQEIAGRTSDNFLMPDGRVVHGEYFTHLFYGRDGIEQFQFVQKSRDEFTLRIVPSGRYRNEMTRLIENEIREMIGAHSKLRIEIHESIPKTATGKYRFTISEVGMEELIGADRP